MAASSVRPPGRPRHGADDIDISIANRLDKWTRQVGTHILWDKGTRYSQPTVKSFAGTNWPVIATTVRYGAKGRKTVYISAAREMWRAKLGYALDPYVSLVTVCGNPLCVRPELQHTAPVIFTNGAGRAYGLDGDFLRIMRGTGHTVEIDPVPGLENVWNYDPALGCDFFGTGTPIFLADPVVKPTKYQERFPANRTPTGQEVDTRPVAPILPTAEDEAEMAGMTDRERELHRQTKYNTSADRN